MPNDISQLKTPIAEFQPDPNQPRKYFDETALSELSESIKQYGVLQPIIYYVNESGQKIIVAGERHTKNNQAAQKAQLSEIPAIVIDGNEADKAILTKKKELCTPAYLTACATIPDLITSFRNAIVSENCYVYSDFTYLSLLNC
ncbi:MAG: ParB N-terminal domain-containing protein [Bacteroidales bacterium]|nr:ParB N-terminal domain-containing protein [Bacteroidales bacterium]